MLQDDAGHRRLKFERFAEITMGELLEIVSLLHVNWQVEPKRVARLRDLAGCRAFAEHLLDGIVGHDVRHEKDEREGEPQRGKREKDAFEDVASHAILNRRENGRFRPLSCSGDAISLNSCRGSSAAKNAASD